MLVDGGLADNTGLETLRLAPQTRVVVSQGTYAY